MTGTYIIPAIEPYCSEVRTRVRVVDPSESKPLPGRIILLDLEMEARGCKYWIDTTLESFQPDNL